MFYCVFCIVFIPVGVDEGGVCARLGHWCVGVQFTGGVVLCGVVRLTRGSVCLVLVFMCS